MKPEKKLSTKGKSKSSPVKGFQSIASMFKRQQRNQSFIFKQPGSNDPKENKEIMFTEQPAEDTSEVVSKYFSPTKSNSMVQDSVLNGSAPRGESIIDTRFISKLSLKRKRQSVHVSPVSKMLAVERQTDETNESHSDHKISVRLAEKTESDCHPLKSSLTDNSEDTEVICNGGNVGTTSTVPSSFGGNSEPAKSSVCCETIDAALAHFSTDKQTIDVQKQRQEKQCSNSEVGNGDSPRGSTLVCGEIQSCYSKTDKPVGSDDASGNVEMSCMDNILEPCSSSDQLLSVGGTAENCLEACDAEDSQCYHGDNKARMSELKVNVIADISQESCNDSQNSLTQSKRDSQSDTQLLVDSEESYVNKNEQSKTNNDDDDDGDETEKVINQAEDNEEPFRVPYYLENFQLILDSVLNEEFYGYLFNEDDLQTINSFKDLSESSQKLYVRLFQRKHKWHRKSKIVYPKIAEDLSECINELVSTGLLFDEALLNDLGEVLNVLPAPDIKTIAKTLRLPASAGSTRESLMAAIYKHSHQSNITSFFPKSKSNSTPEVVLKRAKSCLGSCYKLCGVKRSVFMSVVMLFGIHRTNSDEDENAGAQQQLFEILMSNIGRVKYPEYKIYRKHRIFLDRNSFLRYSSAVQLDSDLADALETKDWDKASQLYEAAKTQAEEIFQNDTCRSHDKSLPVYLRTYTAGAQYVRALSRGVDLLQFTKQYKQAVDQLEKLLGQDTYHQDYRGRWSDRLALNLDFHLKQPNKAFDVIANALSDPWVRVGHRYSLWQRAHKLCHGNNKQIRKRRALIETDSMAKVKEAPKVTIEGRLLTKNIPGANAVYIHDVEDSGDDTVTALKRVEDVALIHYKNSGYPQGIHGEGTTFATLFCLFFWDIVFCDDISDVFYNKYQTAPLDLYTDHFYTARQAAFDEKLQMIRQSDKEVLVSEVRESWEAHYETYCGGLNWALFTDAEHVTGLVRCMGGESMAAIFQRMVMNLRFVRSGVPDLVVWNPQNETFRVVEVKGPGDRLSTKQILWLDYLISVGVAAEVCHVQAVGAKKLKMK